MLQPKTGPSAELLSGTANVTRYKLNVSTNYGSENYQKDGSEGLEVPGVGTESRATRETCSKVFVTGTGNSIFSGDECDLPRGGLCNLGQCERKEKRDGKSASCDWSVGLVLVHSLLRRFIV